MVESGLGWFETKLKEVSFITCPLVLRLGTHLSFSNYSVVPVHACFPFFSQPACSFPALFFVTFDHRGPGGREGPPWGGG